MDPFVQQLAELCRAHVTRAKWVIVPTHAIGRTLGERIALSGTNWLNLRFVTPLDLALRMGAPFLVERGIEPSEEGLGPALIMRLLLGLPERDGYFRPLANQPTMAQALWTTIRELRMAGVESRAFSGAAFASPAKRNELQALLAAYEQFLVASNRGDMAIVYAEATKRPDWCPIQPADCWTELPNIVWSPLQRTVLDMLPGERIAPRALTITGAAVPRRLSDRAIDQVDGDPSAAPLAHLLSMASTPLSDNIRASINLFHAGGREAEIEEIIRRVLASGASLDQIEIACASDAHAALLWEKALRHDWPITLGPGIAANQTRPGRALLGLCDWIETDFAAGYFRRLLQSGDMGVETDDEGFTASQAARILARAGAGWGRDTYALTLEPLRLAYASRGADPDQSDEYRTVAKEKADLTGKVLDWIVGLITRTPQSDADGKVPLARVIDAALDYIEHTTARKSALDHRAASALFDHVSELRALGSFNCSLSEALRFIRERVETLQVAAERPRPGHLYVCSLSQACYSGRPHLFVVGLEEGRVFPTASEDAVLLDAERLALSPALRLSTDTIDEAVHGVLARLATWTPGPNASITFSYSCRDTREFRETYASWLMLQVYRLRQGVSSASYPDMKAALGEPKWVVPENRRAASSTSTWWLRSVVGSDGAGVAAVVEAFPALARGIEAKRQRSSDTFTEYDGHVPEAGAALDPCAQKAPLSVTELQNVASCPFRFFLNRGLGIYPIDEKDRDRDVWLDPLTRGSELHDLYAMALRRSRDERRPLDRTEDGAWLRRAAEKRLRELQREMPPATSEILERETEDFLGDVELFVEAEADRGGSSEPVALEVSFGRALNDDEEPLARPDPVEIDLGNGLVFRFAGRIDRIDKVGPAAFEVIDYKTGGYFRDDWRGTFNGGRRLQHALYGLAAAALLRARYAAPDVVAGVYYFSSRKGRRERVRIAAPSKTAIADVMADLRSVIVTGGFVHARQESDCRFCDYTAACDKSLDTRAAAQKLTDPKLESFGRLGAHV